MVDPPAILFPPTILRFVAVCLGRSRWRIGKLKIKKLPTVFHKLGQHAAPLFVQKVVRYIVISRIGFAPRQHEAFVVYVARSAATRARVTRRAVMKIPSLPAVQTFGVGVVALAVGVAAHKFKGVCCSCFLVVVVVRGCFGTKGVRQKGFGFGRHHQPRFHFSQKDLHRLQMSLEMRQKGNQDIVLEEGTFFKVIGIIRKRRFAFVVKHAFRTL
mmetsp:Transcript_5961/g.16686  ORF Transcript_5961/g.16686 Transcript_5961/m.16686 type:complete len:214 (-) Transcript_5961:654-1295(-)